MKWVLIYFICVSDHCTNITATFETEYACKAAIGDINIGLLGLSDNRKFDFFSVCRGAE